MNAKVLAFPLCVAAVASLDACQGISPTSPLVKPCHDDTTTWYTKDGLWRIDSIHPDQRPSCWKKAA